MMLIFGRLLFFSSILVAGAGFVNAQMKPAADSNASPTSPQAAAEPVLQTHDPRYELRIGDTFDIGFRLTPEFNQTVTVQPDGYINLRDLPDLHVAGKTTPEITEILKKRYSRILHDPEITLMLKDFEKPYFIANGELGKPGKYELRGDTTVLEAIGIAGGINEKSKHSQVLLFRRASDKWMSVKVLDVKQMINSGDLTEDLHLRPGDMIYVPKNALSKIKPWMPIPTMGIHWPW